MIHPTGILRNIRTGRFHPIVFKPAPMPGFIYENSSVLRHKSLGHHTEGFDTKELALEYVNSRPEFKLIDGLEYEWDEIEDSIPAKIEFIEK